MINPLKTYTLYFKIGALLAILAVGGYFVHDYIQRGSDIKLKEEKITNLDKQVTEVTNIANGNAQAYKEFVVESRNILEAHRKVMEAERRSIEISNSINERFTKGGRDIGKLAAAKPELIENIINKAVKKRFECYELITRGQSDASNEFCPDYFPTTDSK